MSNTYIGACLLKDTYSSVPTLERMGRGWGEYGEREGRGGRAVACPGIHKGGVGKNLKI